MTLLDGQGFNNAGKPSPREPPIKTRHLATAALAALNLFTLSGAAQAAMIDCGGGLIYGTELNSPRLADMDHAKSDQRQQATNTLVKSVTHAEKQARCNPSTPASLRGGGLPF